MTDTGDGTEALTFTRPPLALAWDVLDASYGHVRRRLDVHPEQDAQGPADARSDAQLAFDEPAAPNSR
ncbi:hypothetical protein ABIE67_000154 [Streptomyces sp. V4I8]|uniref:hypothetical protein n=1 Tax=Streptomyces sp. V4I8 TaxID=3156469 RepID=UPI00351813E0